MSEAIRTTLTFGTGLMLIYCLLCAARCNRPPRLPPQEPLPRATGPNVEGRAALAGPGSPLARVSLYQAPLGIHQKFLQDIEKK